MKRIVLTLLALALLAGAGALALAWRDLESFRTTPYGGPDEKLVEIPSGSSARSPSGTVKWYSLTSPR